MRQSDSDTIENGKKHCLILLWDKIFSTKPLLQQNSRISQIKAIFTTK